jgi:CheY-like chemotaxis protein
MTPNRVLVATTDAGLLRSLAGLLAADCEVVAAANGLDCLGKLRSAPPDLLILVPPLIWGSEGGVLAVMQADRALRDVPILFLAESDAFQATAETDPPAGLRRVIFRVCRWVRQNRPQTRPALLSASPSAPDRVYA